MSDWNEIPESVSDMRRRALLEVFTPATAVDSREIFRGRTDQLLRIDEVVSQRGQHAVIYGERGVGKTSLAKVSRLIAGARSMFNAHVTCHSGDTFTSIWRNVFAEIRMLDEEGAATAADSFLIEGDLSPNEVRVALRELTVGTPAVIFIDEFDVVGDALTRRQMAETIKVLSDQGINATVVLVGVADSVTDLIAEHESIERNLIQVPMPRMDVAYLIEIIESGLGIAEMSIDAGAAERIAALSQGLPQFVHLLAQRAAILAVDEDHDHVTDAHVTRAIEVALDNMHASVTRVYYSAVTANRETLYPRVVLACAMVVPDDRGFFAAKDVVAPLSKIMGRQYEIPAFGPHLDKLASERGPLLRKEGQPRRFRYRFLNPLMQPYVLMKGLADKSIQWTDLEQRSI